MARVRMRLASSSPMNSSFAGSNFTWRSSIQQWPPHGTHMRRAGMSAWPPAGPGIHAVENRRSRHPDSTGFRPLVPDSLRPANRAATILFLLRK